MQSSLLVLLLLKLLIVKSQTGDFNLPSANWNVDSPVATSAGDMEFLDCFSSLGLTQIVHIPTLVPSDRILDLVFSSDPLITAFVDVLPPIPGCGHCPVVATGFFKSDPPNPPPS